MLFLALLFIDRVYAPTVATFHGHCKFRISLFDLFLDQTLLDFSCSEKLIEAGHCLVDSEHFAVNAVDLVDRLLNLAHHCIGHRHGAELENVAVADVQTVD